MSDDYFTMLDDNEGTMLQTGSQDMELAVGRMLVSDLKQAEEMVTKVIEYHAIESYGKWRNNFVLISDDVDVAWENSIQTGIDALGDQISAQKPFINVEKYIPTLMFRKLLPEVSVIQKPEKILLTP